MIKKNSFTIKVDKIYKIITIKKTLKMNLIY